MDGVSSEGPNYNPSIARKSPLSLNESQSLCPYVSMVRCLADFVIPLSRRVELERKLQADVLMSEERKNRQRAQHGKRESQYLRLRRTKIGLDDFRTVKVIGKGAFGEVC